MTRCPPPLNMSLVLISILQRMSYLSMIMIQYKLLLVLFWLIHGKAYQLALSVLLHFKCLITLHLLLITSLPEKTIYRIHYKRPLLNWSYEPDMAKIGTYCSAEDKESSTSIEYILTLRLFYPRVDDVLGLFNWIPDEPLCNDAASPLLCLSRLCRESLVGRSSSSYVVVEKNQSQTLRFWWWSIVYYREGTAARITTHRVAIQLRR
jgi:hypothetical protein